MAAGRVVVDRACQDSVAIVIKRRVGCLGPQKPVIEGIENVVDRRERIRGRGGAGGSRTR